MAFAEVFRPAPIEDDHAVLRLNGSAVATTEGLMGKNGDLGGSEGDEECIDKEEVRKRLKHVAGTALHAAMCEYLSGFPQKPVELRLSERLWGEQVLANDSEVVEFWLRDEGEDGVTEDTREALHESKERLKRLGHHKLPNIAIPEGRTDLQNYIKNEWEKVIHTHAQVMTYLTENHPYFTDERYLVLPEVSYYPPVHAMEQLQELLHSKPENPLQMKMQLDEEDDEEVYQNLNIYRALDLDKKEMEDYLFRIMALREHPLERFARSFELLETQEQPDLNAWLKLFSNLNQREIAGWLSHKLTAGEITQDDCERILALRIVCRAVHELKQFMGGKALVKTKEELNELLEIFPLKEDLTDEEKEDLYERMPKKTQRIFSPIRLRLDMVVLEMPVDEDGNLTLEKKQALAVIREKAKEIYGVRKNPALFQDFEFMRMVDGAVREHGLGIKFGEIKSTLDNLNGVNRGTELKQRRELAFYCLALTPALYCYLYHEYPRSEIGVFDLLAHPLLKAVKGTFILKVGKSEAENSGVFPQLEIKETFNPNERQRGMKQKLKKDKETGEREVVEVMEWAHRKRFLKRAKQINNAMLIRWIRIQLQEEQRRREEAFQESEETNLAE